MASIIIKEVSNGYIVEFENMAENFRETEIYATFQQVLEILGKVERIGIDQQ